MLSTLAARRCAGRSRPHDLRVLQHGPAHALRAWLPRPESSQNRVPCSKFVRNACPKTCGGGSEVCVTPGSSKATELALAIPVDETPRVRTLSGPVDMAPKERALK